MQIIIDKKTGSFLGVVALLLALVGYFVFNGAGSDNGTNNMSPGMNGNQSSGINLTSSDVMFLQMMIPHHQQAIEMSDLALSISQDSELLALARSISESQSAEIIKMKNWLKQAGASEDMGHMGHSMGGMLSDADLAKLKTLTGSAFDKFWLAGMTGHHDGAIDMTTMVSETQNSDIKAFGLQIVADQSAQITQMKAMLGRL